MSGTRSARTLLKSAARDDGDLRALIAGLGASRDEALGPVLEALLEEERKDTLLRAEERWLGRLGWRLSRPLLACALVASPLFLWQRAVPPVQGLVLFLVGATFFFVILQVYLQRWTRRVEVAKERRQEERRRRLEELAEELAP